MAKAFTFDQQSIQRIAAAVRRLESSPANKLRKDRPAPSTLGKERWFGKTATCTKWPTYPDPPATSGTGADTYCIQLLERWIDETSGPGERDQEENAEARYILARLACTDADTRYVAEGTQVRVWKMPTRRGSRYYFEPLNEQERLFELVSALACGGTATAKLLIGPGPGVVSAVQFQVADEVGLVTTLPGAPDEAPVGAKGIAKWFHDRGAWSVLALGTCEEDPCDYTGAITVAAGDLYVSGCALCQSTLTLTYDKGRLCEVTFNEDTCISPNFPTVEGGTCITVTSTLAESGCLVYTVNNDMELVAGDCISINGEGCEKTIANTMTLSAGTCIEVVKDGCDYTINNTLDVIGGNGIKVQKNGCVYSVGLDSSVANPKTTLRFLCGVELSPIQIACVEDEYGDWTFSVTGGVLTEHFTSITVPSAMIEDVTTECSDDEYGEYGVDPLPPPVGCEDCAACATGEIPIFNPTTEHCDCITDEALLPVGYIVCGHRVGEYMTVAEVNCDAEVPYFTFTLNEWPAGALSAEITVVGDKGSGADVGPLNHINCIVGQEYWGALQESWGQVQPGECFEITVYFYAQSPPGGTLIATQVFTLCCE